MQSLALGLACSTQKENEQISPGPTPTQRCTGRACWKSNLSCQIKQFMEGVSLIELYYQRTKRRGQGNQLVSEFCKPPCTSEPECWSGHCPHSGTVAHGRKQALEKLHVLQLSDAGEAVQSASVKLQKGHPLCRSFVLEKLCLFKESALELLCTSGAWRRKSQMWCRKIQGAWKRKMECRSPAPETCVCSRSLQPGKTVLPCCSSILFWKSLISCSMVEGKYLKDLAPLFAEYAVRFGFVAEK